MKIVAMGSGGVGGYFGAKLAKGGADVTFVARGRHLAALQSEGLRIEGPEPLHLPTVDATDDPARIKGPADIVMVAVKLWDTEDALARIRPLVGPETAVVSFQNGVLKDEAIGAAFPAANAMGGVAYIAAVIDRPGVIKQTGPMQRLVVGEFGAPSSPRAQAFVAAGKAGGINAEVSADIRRDIWAKFVFLAGLSGATTTMRARVGAIRANPQARAFYGDLMAEVVAVGRAAGVALPADFAADRLKFSDGLPPDMTASMHHDLEAGNRLEVPWLAGAVVALGARLGVPTPLNRAVADILALHADGRAAS